MPNNLTGQVINFEKIKELNKYSNVFVYSPDAKTLIVAASDFSLHILNTQNWSILAILKGHTDRVFSLIYSPDGKTLASASRDKTIKLWDVQNYRLINTLNGHTRSILALAYAPNGKTFASASADYTIRLWDAQCRTLLGTLKLAHTVRKLFYSPDGKTLVSTLRDTSTQMWDISLLVGSNPFFIEKLTTKSRNNFGNNNALKDTRNPTAYGCSPEDWCAPEECPPTVGYDCYPEQCYPEGCNP